MQSQERVPLQPWLGSTLLRSPARTATSRYAAVSCRFARGQPSAGSAEARLLRMQKAVVYRSGLIHWRSYLSTVRVQQVMMQLFRSSQQTPAPPPKKRNMKEWGSSELWNVSVQRGQKCVKRCCWSTDLPTIVTPVFVLLDNFSLADWTWHFYSWFQNLISVIILEMLTI